MERIQIQLIENCLDYGAAWVLITFLIDHKSLNPIWSKLAYKPQ
jgi:hypothetical protein